MNSSCMRETRGRGGREGEGTYYSTAHTITEEVRGSLSPPLFPLCLTVRQRRARVGTEEGWSRGRRLG